MGEEPQLPKQHIETRTELITLILKNLAKKIEENQWWKRVMSKDIAIPII